MNYKETKHAKEIISRQTKDGLWTGYHMLSVPRKDTDTMEENLRRLEILGFTYDDEPVRKTINYLKDNLAGIRLMLEKDGSPLIQDFFVDLINASWIRRFTNDCTEANTIAQKWAKLYTASFSNGTYDKKKYAEEYREIFHAEPFKWAAQKQRNFYEVSILCDVLDEKTEEYFIDYLLQEPKGIYYIYQKRIADLPKQFQSKESIYYLSAIHLLLRYKRSKSKFLFVKDWIMNNQIQPNVWDFGSTSKDGIIFPLSDDWKSESNRIQDSTYFIQQILTQYL